MSEIQVMGESGVDVDVPRDSAPIARVEMEDASRARRAQVLPAERGQAESRQQSVERSIVQHSPEVDKLFAALAKAQAGFGKLARTRRSRITLKTGGGYTHDYETLADVIEATQPSLSENGIAVLQFPFVGQSTITVRTMLAHESGQWLYNDLTATIFGTDPQNIGIGTTYLMRYARKAILGISAPYDDDESRLRRRDDDDEGPAERIRPAAQRRREAQRGGGQEAARSEKPRPATAAAVEVVPAQTGRIEVLRDLDGGGVGVVLEGGYKAGTRDGEIERSLRAYQASNATVELVTRPASAGKTPVIDEVRIVRRQEKK